MKCNVGRTESKIRIGSGVITALIAFFMPLPGPVRFIFGALAAGQLSSGVTRYCPSNEFFNINNCHREEGKMYFEALA